MFPHTQILPTAHAQIFPQVVLRQCRRRSSRSHLVWMRCWAVRSFSPGLEGWPVAHAVSVPGSRYVNMRKWRGKSLNPDLVRPSASGVWSCHGRSRVQDGGRQPRGSGMCPWELGWAMLAADGQWKMEGVELGGTFWSLRRAPGAFMSQPAMGVCLCSPVQVLTWHQRIQLTAFNQPLKNRLFFFPLTLQQLKQFAVLLSVACSR